MSFCSHFEADIRKRELSIYITIILDAGINGIRAIHALTSEDKFAAPAPLPTRGFTFVGRGVGGGRLKHIRAERGYCLKHIRAFKQV